MNEPLRAKRVARQISKADSHSSEPVHAASTERRDPVGPEVKQAVAQIEQQLHSAAPEDRLDVLNSEVRQELTELFDRGVLSADAVLAHVCGIADRHDLWGPDRANEAEIQEIAEQITSVSELDDIPFYAPLPPLSLAEWDARDLPTPDCLLGSLISTTSRMLLAAETGIGKTNLAMAIGLRVAAGEPFLHWSGSGKPRKVLYLDGEMSSRQLRRRLRAERQRLGSSPATFYALCAEDVADFEPLNTNEGQAYLRDDVIAQLGGVDLIIFDNIMSLISGSMVDEISWAEVLPFVRSLTKRSIGQIWINHTGHNEKRSYGTKTREWQMDTVAILERVKRLDTDVSFKMSFSKARERAPSNRGDFMDVEIALVNDAWVYQTEAGGNGSAKKISPQAAKYLAALRQAIADGGGQSADKKAWEAACGQAGLIDLAGERNKIRAQLSRYRKELAAAGMISIEGDLSWPIA
jgi:hypothetical protein